MPYCSVSHKNGYRTAKSLHMLNLFVTLIAGAVGGPKWGVGPVRPEQGLLKLRKELGLYANIRPANFISEGLLAHSPLKPEIAKGTDMIVVRELIGGICECNLGRAYAKPNTVIKILFDASFRLW
jgi:isocitrate/isopropylmalate dehydrogenase